MSSEDFVKASSNNMPTVDIFMVTEFIKNDDRFNAAEMRGAKTAASSREEYGDNAIGYVHLKRENNVCILQCKICPEHKVRAKNYTVTIIIDEKAEKILQVACEDCPASLGGCKHALAFLMWVHKRSEEPSPTEVISYWMKPKLSTVGTSLKFIAAAAFAKTKSTPSTSASSSFLEDIKMEAENKQLQGHVVPYISGKDEELADLSIYKLLTKFVIDGPSKSKEFLKFCSEKMKQVDCVRAEKESRCQSVSPFWYEMRFGRITASKLYEFAQCKTADGVLVQSIVGAYKIFNSKAMKRGKDLEKQF